MSVEAIVALQVVDSTSIGRTVMTAADAAAVRTALGLGTLATQNGTFSGTHSGSSSGTNTGDQDLSSYLTSSTAASTYLPLAGGTLTPSNPANIALTITGATSQTASLQSWTTPTTANNDGYVLRVLPSASSANGYNGVVRLGRNASIIVDTSNYSNTPAICSSTTGNGAGFLFVGDEARYVHGGGITARFAGGAFSVTGTITASSTLTAASVVIQNSTTPTEFNLHNTYTSSTSREYLKALATTGGAYQIGSAIGSSGGSNRAVEIGHFNSAGTFTSALSVATSGAVTFTPNIAVTNTAWAAGAWACNSAGGNVGLYTGATGASGGRIVFFDSTGILYGSGGGQNAYMNYDGWAGHKFTVTSTAGSTPIPFSFTDAAHTSLAASTEMTSVNFNLAQTKTFATGAITTQRAMRIQAPTYSFVGASTITTASTLSISGPPVAGTNATITNAYALNVESGKVNLTAGGDSSYGIGTGTSGVSFFGGALFYTIGLYPAYVISTGIRVGRNLGYYWSSNDGDAYTATTLALMRDADNILAQRNGTNAQTFRLYNTYTSTTNYERAVIDWQTTANTLRIGTEKGSGGGSARALTLITDGTVRVNIASDGSSFYLGPTADNTSSGGNARGSNAIDLQLSRASATQVASGNAAIAIGISNTSSGTYTTALGVACSSSGIYSTAIGYNCSATNGIAMGDGCSVATNGYISIGNACASSNYGLLAIGLSCIASNIHAVAIGRANTASEWNTVALGWESVADRHSQQAYAGGKFAVAGDNQAVRFLLRNKTTNATPTTLFADGSSVRLTIPSGKILFADVLVSGIKSDGSAAATYKRKVAIKNVGGTTSLVGTVETIGTDYEDNASTDCVITADDTNDALQINVTGITGETWRWVAVVEGLELAYGT